jgi:hypothetical protein
MRLAAEGAAVAVVDINAESGRETMRHIAAAGGRAEPPALIPVGDPGYVTLEPL